MTEKYYAHNLEGRPPSDWQSLKEHLKNVAEMVRSFADAFNAEEWGYLAGLWHDVGRS
jgi:HD superfamily phosphohydrolase YqeK